MKYGIKLPYDILAGEMSEISRAICDAFGGTDGLLAYYAANLDSVELATVSSQTDGDELLVACRRCAEYKLFLTVHGSMDGVTDAGAFWKPYLPLFASGLQESYTVTVHPLKDPTESERLLRAVCAKAEAEGYPVTLMLENQCDRKGRYPHWLCRSVADTVRQIGSPYLRMCFDFGHQLFNVQAKGADGDPFDGAVFPLIGHTHIHAVSSGATHFPLDGGEVLLEENLTGLMRCGYDGVLMLELLPGRYMDRFDIRESIVSSVSILKTAVHQTAAKLRAAADFSENYVSHVESVRLAAEKFVCGFGVIGTAAYLVKMGETRIAVDPSLWGLPVGAEGRQALLDLLGTCDAVIVTHTHEDHFDRGLIAELCADVPLYLPDFLSCERENVIVTHDGASYRIGSMILHVFASAHSEIHADGSLGGVPEYGFAIEYDGAYTVFPTDVRTYEKAHATFPHTKALIAHLWLGRAQGLNVHDNPCAEKFCAFVESFGAERVFLSHLCDVRRAIRDIWTDVNAALVTDRLKNTALLRIGQWVDL
ncbi:MAG: MBL fold metallo-hydrolase [Clostridia bacterium]|nr:MBL fold metallo-hydrolase [Clostridia bacterium]